MADKNEDFLEFEIRPKMDRGIKNTINNSLKGVTSSFKNIGNGISGVSDKIKSTFSGDVFKGATDGASNLMSKIGGIAVALGGVTAVAAGINIASNFSEETGKLEFAFGEQSDNIKKFIESLDEQYGIGITDTTSFVASLGTKLKGLGVAEDELATFAESLTKMSMDMAEAFHMDPGQMSEMLSQALTGQTRALKQFGIVIDETELKKELLAKGIKFENLDEAGKAKVMLNELNRQLSETGMKGFRENMLGSFETSLESVQARFKDITALTFTPLMNSLAEPLMKISNLLKNNKEFFSTFGEGLASSMGGIANVFSQTEKALAGLFSSISNFILNLNLGDGLKEFINLFVESFNFLASELSDFFNFLTENSDGFKMLFSGIGTAIELLKPVMKLFVSGFVDGLKIIIGTINLLLEGLGKLFNFLEDIGLKIGKLTENKTGVSVSEMQTGNESFSVTKPIEVVESFSAVTPNLNESITNNSAVQNNSNNISMNFNNTGQDLANRLKMSVDKTIEDHNREQELQFGVI